LLPQLENLTEITHKMKAIKNKKMKRLHEKIMIGLLVISIIGFLMAPCCWHEAPKTSAKSIIDCSGNAIVFHDALPQKNNKEVHSIKDSANKF